MGSRENENQRDVNALIQFPNIKVVDVNVQKELPRLRWVQPGVRRNIGGIETNGGFFILEPKFQELSFAIDPTLPVGDADYPQPLTDAPHLLAYWRLSHNQRAYFLKFLSGRLAPPRADLIDPYVNLQLSGLEWSLFVQQDTGSHLLEAACDLVDRVTHYSWEPVLQFIAWWAALRGQQESMAVWEAVCDSRVWNVPLDIVNFGLLACSQVRRRMSAEMIFSLAWARSRDFARTCRDTQVQRRVIDRLKAVYPKGLEFKISQQERRTCYYRPACPELVDARIVQCRVPFTTEIPEVHGLRDLVARVESIASGIVNGPRIDAVKLKRLKVETSRVQADLAERLPAHLVQPPTVPKTNSELSHGDRAALAELIQRFTWTSEDFLALARKHHTMPFALQEKLNSWCVVNFGEPLLTGDGPIEVEQTVINKLKHLCQSLNENGML